MTQRAEVEAIARQIGSAMLPDNDQWVNRFTIRSETSSATYVVAQRRVPTKADGAWGCSCWAWRRNRRCKHIEKILGRLAALPMAAFAGACEPTTLGMLASARMAHLDLDEKHDRIEVTTPAKARLVDL